MSAVRGIAGPMLKFLLSDSPITSLDAYLATEFGGLGVAAAQHLGPEATIQMVLESGLRGRGGGGFSTGRKWAGIANEGDGRRYVVCNGAEGEPGTFKDRALIRNNPYQFVEGMIIAAYAVGADEAYVCLKRSFEREIEAVTRAVQEFQNAGICRDCVVNIVAGPDEYLFGEETAMLEVIEGKPPLPRWFRPHVHGLFAATPQEGWEAGPHGVAARTEDANPTLVSNVETLSNIPVSYEGFQALGSGMGSAGFIVYDDTTPSMDRALRRLVDHDRRHSGGGPPRPGRERGGATLRCRPARRGNPWIRRLQRASSGQRRSEVAPERGRPNRGRPPRE